MMFLEMHFEIVAPDTGGVRIYYSNEMRIDMPASVVSDVAVEIERPGEFMNRSPCLLVMMEVTGAGTAHR